MMQPCRIAQLGSALLAMGCGGAVGSESGRGPDGAVPPISDAGVNSDLDSDTGGPDGGVPPASDALADSGLDAGVDAIPPTGLLPLDGVIADAGCVGPYNYTLEPDPLVPCDYLFPMDEGTCVVPAEFEMLYVGSDGTQYLVVANQAKVCELGWQFIHEGDGAVCYSMGDTAYGAHVRTCGPTCERIQDDPGAQITLWVKCPGPQTP